MGTMVTMFAPDGSTGDIPASNVQAAQQAGFKRAMTMVAPDGKSTGYIPEDRVNDAAKAGFRFGTADQEQPSTASLYGKALFNPLGSGAASGVSGAIEQAGGRAMQGMVNTVAHPIDAITGAVNAIRHPIDTAAQRVGEFQNEWKQSPSLALANAAGDVLGTVEGGRIGGAVASKAADLGVSGASRAALLGKTPEGAYESAMKPATTISQADRANMVQAGLQNAIPISKGGLEKLGNLIDDYNQKIKAVIDTDPTRPIDPNSVATRTNDTLSRFSNQVNAGKDLADIQKSRNMFLAEQGATPGSPAPPMNAAAAQSMKQGTYQILKGKFGEQGSAAVEAQKDLARGLKEEIANQFPEINGLNAQESRLLDLQPVLERAVNRTSNHQLIGIGTPIAGAAAKAVTGSGSVGVVTSALKSVLDNPMVKSRLAIAVSKGGKIPIAQAMAKVGAYSAALGSTAHDSQAYPSADNPTQPTPQQP